MTRDIHYTTDEEEWPESGATDFTRGTTPTTTKAQEDWEKEFDEKFVNNIFYGVACFFKDEQGNYDRQVGQEVVEQIKAFISAQRQQAAEEATRKVLEDVIKAINTIKNSSGDESPMAWFDALYCVRSAIEHLAVRDKIKGGNHD